MNCEGDDISTELFDIQMKIVASYFNPLPLSEAVERLKSGTLPSHAVCVTFDDGYLDNITEALPVLKKYNISATFFIAASFLDDGIMWNDAVIESIRNVTTEYFDLTDIGLENYRMTNWQEKNHAKHKILSALKYKQLAERNKLIQHVIRKSGHDVANNLMMSSKQVKELFDQGMEIGGHTINHPILAKISDHESIKEIKDGKKQLEDMIGERITSFAYPNGRPNQDYFQQHARIVRNAGFTCAVSTSDGISNINTDPYQLPRTTPWDQSTLKFLIRMLQNHYTTADFAES